MTLGEFDSRREEQTDIDERVDRVCTGFREYPAVSTRQLASERSVTNLDSTKVVSGDGFTPASARWREMTV